MYCTYHDQNPITVICVAKHKCQRKLSLYCQYEHNVDLKELLPIKIFQEKLQNQLDESHLNDTKQLQQSRTSFKQMLCQTEIMIKKLWQRTNEQIKMIYDVVEREIQQKVNVIKNNISPSEQSYKQLNKMVQILQENLFNKWNQKIKSYINQLDKINNQYRAEIEKFCQLINQQFTNNLWEEKIQEYDGLIRVGQRLTKTKFEIIYTKDRELHYVHNGEILHILKNDNQLTQPKIITNLELIKNLKWIGEYGENNQKKGLWQAQLNGQRILRFGGEYSVLNLNEHLYSEDGKKQGEWKEILEIQAIVFEVGEYTLDLRKGTWKYVYQDKNIGGGQYNYNGQKNGQWVEIDELFSEPKIRHIGSYKNGKKIGRWDICWFESYQNQYGSLDQASCKNYLKNWVDMKDNYNNDKSQNGKKVPQFMNNGIEWIKKNIIGGGSYDEVGNGLKLGNWIELWDNFKDNSQITYKGEYKNGKKVGRWDIWFNDGQNKKNIGGGYYDELQHEQKIGNWIEILDISNSKVPILFDGVYQKGKKVGRWNIGFMRSQFYERYGIHSQIDDYSKHLILNNENKNSKDVILDTIGGGQYDETGIKSGIWIELWDNYNDTSQVTYQGGYKNGKKVGRWDIQFNNGKKKKIIGGGYYDELDNGLKSGQWIEVWEGFKENSQVTYIGQYKNEKKIGEWHIWFNSVNRENIGGGSYDEAGNGLKSGIWIELWDNFKDTSSIKYKGEYKNGKKVGRWDIWFNYGKNQKIGGGQYHDAGNRVKLGNWVDVSNDFSDTFQVINKGCYKKGKKVGEWINFMRNENNMNEGLNIISKSQYYF